MSQKRLTQRKENVVISVFPPRRIGLPSKEYYKDSKVVKQYEDTLTQIADALHPDDKNREASHAVIEFEKKLAAASPDAEDADDVTVSIHANHLS